MAVDGVNDSGRLRRNGFDFADFLSFDFGDFLAFLYFWRIFGKFLGLFRGIIGDFEGFFEGQGEATWHKITNTPHFFKKFVILGFFAGKSHNMIGQGIFHGDQDFFDL